MSIFCADILWLTEDAKQTYPFIPNKISLWIEEASLDQGRFHKEALSVGSILIRNIWDTQLELEADNSCSSFVQLKITLSLNKQIPVL